MVTNEKHCFATPPSSGTKELGFISDTHFKNTNFENLLTIKNYLSHHLDDFDGVFFLGDIFEIWLGDIQAFEKYYYPFFELLKTLHENDKLTVFMEGNHEYNIRKSLEPKGVLCYQDDLSLILDKQNVYITHGDLLKGNLLYRLFRKITKNDYFTSIVKWLFPWSTSLYIGFAIAWCSRQKSYRTTFDADRIFNEVARDTDSSVDKIIFGHFHLNKVVESHFPLINKIKTNYCTFSQIKNGKWTFLKYDSKSKKFSHQTVNESEAIAQ